MKKMFVLLWPLWSTPGSTGYNVVVISGCEYIEWNSSTYFLIHKANCTNLIHGHE